jgi:Na+-transporting NADH:ubiquinone oxidoreductase subunit B
MAFLGISPPAKKIMKQKPMLKVCYGLLPMVAASVYFFGWRSLLLLVLITLAGLITEAIFTWRQDKPITQAVLVTCIIFHLSLPPTIPVYMALIGIVVAVAFGKMIFGGFGKNLFNPAMVGRCFIYINFPYAMTGQFADPWWGGLAGLVGWTPGVDAMTRATPLMVLRNGGEVEWLNLFWGNVSGSMGETSAILILLGGAYIVYQKVASWRLVTSCLLGGVMMDLLLYFSGVPNVPLPWTSLAAGSFLFGTFFVVTEPVSGPKKPVGQWSYGFLIGCLVIILRVYSNFAAGVMFAVLIMNAFAPWLDRMADALKKKKPQPAVAK